jgi:hypothetical protein
MGFFTRLNALQLDCVHFSKIFFSNFFFRKLFEKFEKKDLNGMMSSIALGIWVGFLKQPALPGEAPQNKNSSKKILKLKNH